MFLNSRLKIFGYVALVYSLNYLILIYQNRLPMCHDTFQYLQLQYIYFNEIVQNHCFPFWFPFIGQGFVGNYYSTVQLTLLSPLFYFIGLFVSEINYLYLFYFAIWFEELFFLMGVILLSSLYYRNTKTILFVSITLLGTNIWYPQIFWNFHLYYFIPIVLYCIHKCLITGLFRYLILAAMFSALAVYGNFVYCLVFVSFVVLVYVLSIAPVYFSEIKTFLWKNTRLTHILVLLIFITIMLLSFYYIKYADSEITYSFGTRREISGGNSLKTFLTYGGSRGFSKYKEIFRRYGKSADINLYAGFLLPAFVIISLCYCRKKLSFAVGMVALVVFLFSLGTFVSVLFYYLYPLGRIFRHIGLTATIFKLFIVFYAGFGFEIFLDSLSKDKKPNFLKLMFLTTMVCLVGMNYILMHKSYAISSHFRLMSKTEEVIFSTIPYAILSAGVLLLWLMYKTKIGVKHLVNLLLLLIVFDFFFYKYSLIVPRMPRVSDKAINLFKPFKYDFPRERLADTYCHISSNARLKQFLPVLDYNNNKRVSKCGATYNTVDSFFFADSAASSYRTDFVLRSMRQYFDVKEKFPNNNGIYEKYSGVGYPKIEVFSRLNLVDNEIEIGRIFNLDSFTGDMLFATSRDVEGIKDNPSSRLIQKQVIADFENRNERVVSEIEVKNFSFNTLDLTVSVGGPENQDCLFLYYADAYHPHWNAYVNGKKVSVIKSNIGYKSVMIPSGTSEVIFEFGNMFYDISFFCTILTSLFVLTAVVYIFITEMFIHIRNPILSEMDDLSTNSYQKI